MTLNFKSHKVNKARSASNGAIANAASASNSRKPKDAADIERALEEKKASAALEDQSAGNSDTHPSSAPRPKEIGGPSGPEPTRYGDWERNGICSDF